MAEKKKLKKPGWIEEFKAFAIKGNALSMAVGVIIGGGFSTITKSLTDDVIMPIVSMFLGGVNFSQWYITPEPSNEEKLLAEIRDLLKNQ